MPSTPTLTKRNILRTVICVAIAAGFFALFNFRSAASTAALKDDIVKAEATRQRQKILFPVYAEFAKTLKTRASTLPLPEQATLTNDRIGGVQPDISALARSCNLTPQSVVCDPLSLAMETGRMAVDITVTGNLEDFREFYVELGALSYLRRIEHMRVTEAPGETRFQLKTWVAVQSG